MGLVPKFAEPGDTIATAGSCPVALVLRSGGRIEGNEGKFVSVGSCYMHSIVDSLVMNQECHEEIASTPMAFPSVSQMRRIIVYWQ
jgi:hypothetical protein